MSREGMYKNWKEVSKIEGDRGKEPYLFDKDEKGFPVFSDKNIAFVMSMIAYNSQYQTDKENKDKLKKAFKGIVEDGGSYEKGWNRLECIEYAVREIDAANSTRLAVVSNRKQNANLIKKVEVSDDSVLKKDKAQGRVITAKMIEGISASDLRERLGKGDPSLVDDIAHAVEKYVNKGHKSEIKRNNFSFATKFCHWASWYIFGKDNYCIYDNVVSSVLPYYLSIYAKDALEFEDFCKNNERIENYIGKYKDKGYGEYKELYDKLVEGVNEWRGKNGLDQDIRYGEIDRIIWYYFKGANDNRRNEALNVAKTNICGQNQ